MHRDLSSFHPAVEEIDGKQYLRASTGHSCGATLEIRGTRRYLFLENVEFAVAVCETLPYWGSVKCPAAYRSLWEIMSAVSIKPQSADLGTRAKAVALCLCDSCIITMDCSKQVVSMPVDEFVLQALNHFAETKLLDTSGIVNSGFIQKLKLRWEGRK